MSADKDKKSKKKKDKKGTSKEKRKKSTKHKTAILPQKKITIKFEVLDNPQGPVLCAFPGGIPPLADAEFQMLKNTKPRKGHQRILTTECEDWSCVGKNFGDGAEVAAGAKGLTYALGVGSDLGSGAVSLVPVQGGTVFPMTMSLASDPEPTSDQKLAETDYMTKRKLLTDGFGSRKRQRMTRTIMANRIDLKGDDVSLNVLQHALNGVVQVAQESGVVAAAASLSLPPHNAETDVVGEVYPLTNLAGEDVWDALDPTKFLSISKNKDELKEARNSGWYATVVLAGITKLKSVDKDQRKSRAKCLMLLQHMISFYNLPRNKKRETLRKKSHIPELVQEHLLTLFTCSEARGEGIKDDAHPTPLQMKLKCHMCVMALAASSWRLLPDNLEAFAADLKLTATSLLQFFREVGCVNATKTRVALTAPLKLPELERKKGKKSR